MLYTGIDEIRGKGKVSWQQSSRQGGRLGLALPSKISCGRFRWQMSRHLCVL